ncbi:MAG TPA: YbdD/YjiX family protein [Gemmatimonadales bacterium]|nr:YbdD/YjiX family protein [Gemmatimonadales bacterium]
MRSEGAIRHQPSAIGRVRTWIRRIADSRWPMALFGMPDYARYLRHQQARHPGSPVLTEREFIAAELRRKYDGGGPRCC